MITATDPTLPNKRRVLFQSTRTSRRRAASLLGFLVLGGSALSCAHAGDTPDDKLSKPVIEAAPESKIHGLINLELSDHYITPRGLDVENQGVIFQPLLLLFWDLYSSKTGFLNDVSLTTGVWNSWHTRKSGAHPGEWNEIDPISGLTFKVLNDFQLDVFYTAFHSQVDSYPTSTNLDVKLTYHDHFLGDFSINPYVEYFDELDNKATVVLDSATSHTSYYFQFGIDPTYSSKACPVKIELPTYVSVVGSQFYQKFDGGGGGSGVGVFSTELKVSVPLSFIPKGYGSWTAYAGYQYYYLNNAGLLDGNEVLGATTARKHDLYQLHGGISIFF